MTTTLIAVWTFPLVLAFANEFQLAETKALSMDLSCVSWAILGFGILANLSLYVICAKFSAPIYRTHEQRKHEQLEIIPYSLIKPKKPLPLTKTLPHQSLGEVLLTCSGFGTQAAVTAMANALGVRQVPRPLALGNCDRYSQMGAGVCLIAQDHR